MNSSVIVAMSGGVDSAVAALLLVEAGYDVRGVTCRMLGCDSNEGDIADARAICDKVAIPHYVLDCSREFEACVISRFVDEYLDARTPNPCVDCNRHIKFGVLQNFRREHGYDYLATGHYVRVKGNGETGLVELLRAKNVEKDQSYMLCRVPHEELESSLFPLGELAKDEVRALAERAGFTNARKRESQDICFVPDGDYAAFIEGRTGVFAAPGPIVDTTGSELGQHTGLLHYTIGQRKGIGIAAAEPLYVLAKDAARNALIVGTHDELLTREVRGGQLNPLAPLSEEMRVMAKTSYRQSLQPATVVFNVASGTADITFDGPIVRPAPGQALAIYNNTGEVLLAGAVIV